MNTSSTDLETLRRPFNRTISPDLRPLTILQLSCEDAIQQWRQLVTEQQSLIRSHDGEGSFPTTESAFRETSSSQIFQPLSANAIRRVHRIVSQLKCVRQELMAQLPTLEGGGMLSMCEATSAKENEGFDATFVALVLDSPCTSSCTPPLCSGNINGDSPYQVGRRLACRVSLCCLFFSVLLVDLELLPGALATAEGLVAEENIRLVVARRADHSGDCCATGECESTGQDPSTVSSPLGVSFSSLEGDLNEAASAEETQALHSHRSTLADLLLLTPDTDAAVTAATDESASHMTLWHDYVFVEAAHALYLLYVAEDAEAERAVHRWFATTRGSETSADVSSVERQGALQTLSQKDCQALHDVSTLINRLSADDFVDIFGDPFDDLLTSSPSERDALLFALLGFCRTMQSHVLRRAWTARGFGSAVRPLLPEKPPSNDGERCVKHMSLQQWRERCRCNAAGTDTAPVPPAFDVCWALQETCLSSHREPWPLPALFVDKLFTRL